MIVCGQARSRAQWFGGHFDVESSGCFNEGISVEPLKMEFVAHGRFDCVRGTELLQ